MAKTLPSRAAKYCHQELQGKGFCFTQFTASGVTMDLSRGENGVPARMAFEGIKNDEFVFDVLRAYETSGGQVQPQHRGLFQSAHGLQQANFRLQYPYANIRDDHLPIAKITAPQYRQQKQSPSFLHTTFGNLFASSGGWYRTLEGR